MPESHTATEQWQSFELRMRQRRLERCLVRVAAALDADVLDIAKEALEEAQHLSPSDPRLPSLVNRLALAEAPPAAIRKAPRPVAVVEPPAVVFQQPARARGWMWAGALMLIMMSAVAGWFAAAGRATVLQLPSLKTFYDTDAQPARTPAPETTAASSSASSSATLPVTEPPREPEPAPVAAAENVAIVPVADKPAADKPATAPPVEKPAGTTGPESTRTPAVRSKINVAPTPAPLARPAAELRPDPATTNKPAPLTAPAGSPVTVPSIANDAPAVQPAPTLPEPAANTPVAAIPAAAPDTTTRAAATSAPLAKAPAPDASANDERLVRAALNRYAAAYNGLDAAAARAVWPSVDQRALAHAFDGLLSQSIALGQCDVRVNGTSARAECAGSAKWTPKVGGGMQSASRRWRFDLRNTGGDWIIVQAMVR